MDQQYLHRGNLKALIVLLGDEDPRISHLAEEKFKEILLSNPELAETLAEDKDLEIRLPVRVFLEKLRIDSLDEAFGRLTQAEEFDLEYGCYLLALYFYPHLKPDAISGRLDEMAEELEEVLKEERQPERVIAIVNRYLFSKKRFRGNQENYYDPDNSLLHRVIERKAGIPITLSALYLLLGHRLGLPFVGVGLPGHFLIQFEMGEEAILLDPFNRGKIISPADCEAILKQQGIPFDEEYLLAVDARQIMARMIVNLIHIFTQRKEERKVDHLTRFLSTIQR